MLVLHSDMPAGPRAQRSSNVELMWHKTDLPMCTTVAGLAKILAQAGATEKRALDYTR